MWVFESAGRATDVRADLDRVNPVTLPSDIERAILTCLLTTVGAMVPNAGLMIYAITNPGHIQISVRRIKFGPYAV